MTERCSDHERNIFIALSMLALHKGQSLRPLEHSSQRHTCPAGKIREIQSRGRGWTHRMGGGPPLFSSPSRPRRRSCPHPSAHLRRASRPRWSSPQSPILLSGLIGRIRGTTARMTSTNRAAFVGRQKTSCEAVSAYAPSVGIAEPRRRIPIEPEHGERNWPTSSVARSSSPVP